jgi:2-(1,2-epoxy-1,2-dihydrophenyl)acetyl-CoA isomerase
MVAMEQVTARGAEVVDGVLRIVVVDPAGPGQLDGDRMDEAIQALTELAPGVGAVLVGHPGRNFSVGGDVAAFAGADDPEAYVFQLANRFHDFMRALVAAPVPVVAAVRGWAAGAGLSIVAGSDVVIAARGARFRAAYPGIGFSPDGGMSWTLPRVVGRARALDLLLTDRVLDAPTAEAIGLVSRVVDDEALDDEALRTAAGLAQGPTAALGRIKALVQAGARSDWDEHLDAEAAAISASAATPDGREGVAAFVARRQPRFR